MNRLVWTTLLDGHIECFEHQFGPQVAGYLPASALSAVGIDDGQIQIPCRSRYAKRRYLRDVCHPEIVGPVGRNVLVHEIGQGSPRIVSDDRRRRLPTFRLPLSKGWPPRFLPT
jgi:hypothetical protein